MNQKRILLDHGSGGRLSQELIENTFLPHLGNPLLNRLDDGAVFELAGGRLAMSTDSYVVTPLFFPGGDIGSLAVHGTVNDLACCGATPLYLSAGFIIEEGFLLADLERILTSMRAAAQEAGVSIITGDTKVVNQGACDGIFINTAGVGMIPEGIQVGGSLAEPGDVVMISGYIADHGVTILCQRQGLPLTSEIKSDSAPLNHMVQALLTAAPHTHVLRDPTRGGLATSLNEIAAQSEVCLELEEEALPIRPQVAAACEILGLDPLYLANEGKLIAIVPASEADAALKALQTHPLGFEARILGHVVTGHPGRVILNTSLGTTRVVDMLSGEPLPRIC
jgi:hydrogenase expression/formation protein HypE